MYSAELEIGIPKNGWLCTAIVHNDYQHLVSYNDVSYWCYLDEYGIQIKIGKHTPEGAQITRAIQYKSSPQKIERMLLAFSIPLLTPAQFINITNQIREDAFEDGQNSLRESLKKLLALE